MSLKNLKLKDRQWKLFILIIPISLLTYPVEDQRIAGVNPSTRRVREGSYSLDMLPVCQTVNTFKRTNTFTLAFTPTGNLELPVHKTRMSLYCGRKRICWRKPLQTQIYVLGLLAPTHCFTIICRKILLNMFFSPTYTSHFTSWIIQTLPQIKKCMHVL